MIPKVIHYCWFGRGPLPELAKKCISSWKKYCPDYEIKEWNEDNFDINKHQFTQEAYIEKNMLLFLITQDYRLFTIMVVFILILMLRL